MKRRTARMLERRGATLLDIEAGCSYTPTSLRDALGWVAAGENTLDFPNVATSLRAAWWHRHHQGDTP